jgi:putative ABC transport system permease protein
VALDQLWGVVRIAERAMLAVTALVVLVGLAGLVAVLLAGLNERRRELAILRSVGAGPWQIGALVVLETLFATAVGTVLGALGVACASLLGGAWLQSAYGLTIPIQPVSTGEWGILGGVLAAGLLAGTIPAWRAARISLADGLSPRL